MGRFLDVPASEIRDGDRVWLKKKGWRGALVSLIKSYEDGRVGICFPGSDKLQPTEIICDPKEIVRIERYLIRADEIAYADSIVIAARQWIVIRVSKSKENGIRVSLVNYVDDKETLKVYEPDEMVYIL